MLFLLFFLYGGFWIWWLTALILLIAFEEHRNRKFLTYFATSFGLTYFIVNIVLKNIFMRSRPILNSACPIDYSFPSTHAATAFAAAVVLSRFDPKRKYFYYFGAVVVSFSRIYLECHYLGDVLVGGLIGALIGKIILSIPLSYNKRRRIVHKK